MALQLQQLLHPQGFLRTFIYKIGLSGIGFLTAIATARYLGPEGRGVFSLVSFYMGVYISVFGAFGYYASYASNRLGQELQPIFRLSVTWILLVSGVTFAAAALLLGYGPLWQGPDHRFYLYGLIATPFALLIGLTTLTLNGLHEMERLNRANMAQALVFLILAGGVLLLFPELGRQNRLQSVFAGWIASYLLAALYTARSLKQAARLSFKPLWTPSGWQPFLSFGSQLAVSNAIQTLNARIDYLMVGGLLSSAEVGIYSIALVASEVMSFISITVSQLMYKKVSSPDRAESIQITVRAFRTTLLYSIAGGLAAVLLLPPVIRFVFSRDFAASILPFQILVPGASLYGLFLILVTFFTNQLGLTRIRIYIETAGGLVNAGVCYWLIPRLGLAGAAIGSSSAYLVCSVLAFVIFIRQTRLHWRKLVFAAG